MDEKTDKHEVLNMFLSEIFDQQMPKRFPEIEITPENKPLYFKLWCAGVSSGMELDEAVKDIKDLEK